ncbi:MAG: metallophosphoesterase [Chloroflexi bacterium]|nr:MAG: metallophosphoesterase [Chloroflexota bacterium]
MLIGVLSDIHDNLDNLQKALEAFKRRGVETLIFCGDFCSPIPSRALGAGFSGDIHVVFGNGDGDRFAISGVSREMYPHLKLHGEYAELELDGVKIAVTHYPFYARALARTGDYRAVFSGHTHERHQETIGECLWLNPGEILGWKGDPSCAVYNTATHTAEYIFLNRD